MSLVEEVGEKLRIAQLMSTRIRRNLNDENWSKAIANYSSLDSVQQDYIRLQDYWHKLDEAIEKGVYGQI